MLLDRLSVLEAGLGIKANNEDHTDCELSASKTVDNATDYQALVIDESHKKPNKKKRK